jgi:hypothetical protein
MSETESVPRKRLVWPADYYALPTPPAVLPRGVTFGCGAASVVILLLVFGGGIFLAKGGLVDLMDLIFGMSLGEMRGMYTADVTPAQKKALENSVEQLRAGLREGKVPVAKLDPVLQNMRKGMDDKKMQASEVDALTREARKAASASAKLRP